MNFNIACITFLFKKRPHMVHVGNYLGKNPFHIALEHQNKQLCNIFLPHMTLDELLFANSRYHQPLTSILNDHLPKGNTLEKNVFRHILKTNFLI